MYSSSEDMSRHLHGDLGAELGIVKKSGSWFSYNDKKIAQGRDAAKQVILDNPELLGVKGAQAG